MLVMTASERTPRVLSEKYNFDRGYPGRNLNINVQNQKKKMTLLWFRKRIFSLENKTIF